MIEEKYTKSIQSETEIIEKIFQKESFIISHDLGFPINEAKISLSKGTGNKHIDFNLELQNSLDPNNITFKKLGFNKNCKLISTDRIFVIPPKGVTKVKGKRFVPTNQITGEITTIYDEQFPLSSASNFRLILKINDEDFGTIFLGAGYSCDGTHYALGLVRLNIENIEYHVFRHNERSNSKTYLTIECLDVTNFKSFREDCELILKSVGFLTGNWHQDEHYFFSYTSNDFKLAKYIYYKLFGDSVITNFEIINPQQFRSFIHTDPSNYPELTPLLFSEKILSTIVNELKSKPELERAIELLVDGNEIKSPLIRCSIFSVALETAVSLIHSENKAFFKPIKKTEQLTPILKEFHDIANREKDKFSQLEYSSLTKKITYLNTPFNKDKFILAFERYKVNLPEKYSVLLNTRNLFFHGKTPYEEGVLKNRIKDLHLEADRIHMLVSILILKYVGYEGHIKNQAAYRLETESFYNETERQTGESAFYTI
ncbi:hypothetical protein [Flavobacterium sp. M31R6]|uniref:hypothetical protein n=1 Tax=Flavobacterium sp. M31R6 TaxID=2739062 RepID=UPI001568C66B|nr:hypothetical protein [Flavobacterium sp. M31R6]QKJ61731.1 hypothetical protein HQN62_00875 [Flavobacterium sp. M31R6]